MKNVVPKIGWFAVALLAAYSLGLLATERGEQVNAVWMIVAAVSLYFIAYRFYARFIALRVMQIEAMRMTPAVKFNDGLDYVPTNKWVLYGHHFAAIAGAGPLVGPILAAQMGYLPGMMWIIFGVILAGAVQDSLILFMSTRRDGRSLGEMIKTELGTGAGVVAMIGILVIMMILLAVLAMVVVYALANSPWGTFTVFATIPIAILMGVYMRYIRPGRIGEGSIIGVALLLLAIVGGRWVQESATLAPLFTYTALQLSYLLIAYGFVASVLPVWFLLAPRDYLSTFLKVGTIVGLAFGILIVAPYLKLPAVSKFVDGTGPVFAGDLFPFLFITIACGAISGFHALVSSGTTPKMIENERQIPFIGYGGMLMESFVAIMALVAASTLEPGVYFAMNSPASEIGTTAQSAAAAFNSTVEGATFNGANVSIEPVMLETLAVEVGEKTILSRTGGAPTLAVGMAKILGEVISGEGMIAFWYHFAILFEALFILTTIDAGTRVGRFLIQDLLGTFYKPLARTRSWPANVVATAICVAGWGFILYQAVTNPEGGVKGLWPLFGIANQMLAVCALTLATVILVKMKRMRYVWVPLVPLVWLLVCTMTAAWQKLFHASPKIGFIAQVNRYLDGIANNQVLAPAKDMAGMHQVVFNGYLSITLCVIFMGVVLFMLFFGVKAALLAMKSDKPTARESEVIYYDEKDVARVTA